MLNNYGFVMHGKVVNYGKRFVMHGKVVNFGSPPFMVMGASPKAA
jgi:hypothetical protein